MSIRLEIVTAERQVYSEDVDMVVAPGMDGELGVMPKHAPLLTILQPGELLFTKGGDEISMAVSGGFLEVYPDKVIVLADTAERADEIDLARAEDAMNRAQESLKTGPKDVDLQQAMAAARRSFARQKVAQRRRSRGGMGQPRE